jgi:hypothetical protein
LIVLLLGARAEVYFFPAAKLVPNLIAGTLSGFVTAAILRVFRDEPDTEPICPEEPAAIEPPPPQPLSRAGASEEP